MDNISNNTEALVNTEWVERHLDDPSVVIVEVNTDPDSEYSQGHVPGAIGWDLHNDLEHKSHRDIPGARQMDNLMRESGIHNDSTIVLYGDGNNRSATWGFWILKYYRHSDVRLMDGGRKKWLTEDRPISVEVPTPSPTLYQSEIPDKSVRAMREYVVANLRNRHVKLIDTRSTQEYSGQSPSSPGSPQSGIYRTGRIPGSVHIAWNDSSSEDGSFHTVSELKDMFERKGFKKQDEIITYCRLGVRASYSWFVLKYLLGYKRVRTYDGSWTEWGNSTGVPIETDQSNQ